MKEYELIWERFNPCSGDQHAQTSVKELSLSDPAAYVHQQFHLEKKLRIEQSQAGRAWSLMFTPATFTNVSPLQSCNPARQVEEGHNLGLRRNPISAAAMLLIQFLQKVTGTHALRTGSKAPPAFRQTAQHLPANCPS